MRTRQDYLKNPESFSKKEEAKLVAECVMQVKEHPSFYKDLNDAMGSHYVWLNMKCIHLYEERNKTKLKW